MAGDILLKMISAVTPDDVRQLKAAGCEDEVVTLLTIWDRIAVIWQQAGASNSQVWTDIQKKLNELRSALRG